MTTYVKAHDIEPLIQDVIRKYHPDLLNNEVEISVLFAHASVTESGDPKGPAVTHNGYPAAAKIRVTSLKERVQGLGDAELIIDGDSWMDRTEEQQEALIDHELEHLEVQKTQDGTVKFDDAFRVKLKCRKHDWQLGGFENVSRRHGSNAPEVIEARKTIDRFETFRQKLLFEEMEV